MRKRIFIFDSEMDAIANELFEMPGNKRYKFLQEKFAGKYPDFCYFVGWIKIKLIKKEAELRFALDVMADIAIAGLSIKERAA